MATFRDATEILGSAVLDGTFFRVVTEKSNAQKVVALCVKCDPKRVEIKGTWKSTSNFKSHLRRKHSSTVVAEYETYIEKKRKKTDSPSTQKCRGSLVVTQEDLDRDITNFVIHSLSPLSIVEDPYLIKLFASLGLQNPNFAVMTRRTLGRRIDKMFDDNVESLKTSFKTVSHVCTTADIWSAKRRSFFGVTAHWIDAESLERKSASLACRRFPGTHSFERISAMLQDIQMEYGLDSNKIIATVTDNGSNFVKAFKLFGVQLARMDMNEDYDSSSEESETDNVENTTFTNNDFHLSNARDTEGTIQPLPHHLRCCAHTLSLCATTDLMKCIKASSLLNDLHSQVLLKCTALWNAAGRPKPAEVIESILGHTLTRPGETRWNSLYDSLKQILSVKEKTPLLFKALVIKHACFKPSEFVYIEEHLTCVKPLAEALDILQGEKNIYYGIVLPCLLALRRKLQLLKTNSWTTCTPLVQCLLNSIETRFAAILNMACPESENAAIAAISHPRFKTLWFNCIDTRYHKKLKTLFTNTVAANIELSNAEAATAVTLPADNEDFFNFGTVQNPEKTRIKKTSKAEIKVLQYLEDPSVDTSSLAAHPDIKRVFLRYNTPLPSSAPVERLFSFATMVNCSRGNRLSDKMFEKKVILKANILHDK